MTRLRPTQALDVIEQPQLHPPPTEPPVPPTHEPPVPPTQVDATEAASTPRSQLAKPPSVVSVRSQTLPDNQLGMEQPPTPRTPVATPCRSPSVPTIDDFSQPRPVPGTLHLSEGAIDQRLRRLVTPRTNGTYKVSKDIVEMYKNGGKNRMDVFHMFQSVGFDPDRFLQNVFFRMIFKSPGQKNFNSLELHLMDKKTCTTEGARKCFMLR